MMSLSRGLCGGMLVLCGAMVLQADDTPAAKSARKRLLQKVSIDLKETGAKNFFDEIRREMDQPVSIKLDNLSGISNNTKLTFKCTDMPVHKLLDALSDKYEFGWYVKSDPKDRFDGFVIVRKYKVKERGQEAKSE